ncbi:MAG: sigma 54-interacting transcriptional regulator [Desulfobacula sp.]|jgi:DNA-binding NtrC family response regulator
MDTTVLKHKILIVDDQPENIRILVKLLKNRCKLMAAASGAEALESAMSDARPSLILLDIMMPDMDGYEVCRRLKADKKTRDIPIIFITAMGETEDETKGFELGAVDYITKPFNSAVVEARVNTQLELLAHRSHLEDQVKARTIDLTASEARLSSIINAFRGFIYTCGKKDHFQMNFMNQAFKDWSGDKTGKRNCYYFIFGLDKPCASCPADRVYQGETIEIEYELPKDKKWYHVIHSPVFSDDGSVVKRQAILIDITTQKLREMELLERQENLRRENLRLKTSMRDRYRFGEIVGKSQCMQEVYENILKASATDASTIIYGESGTGKELVAQAIHNHSERKNKKMVTVNCSAIPENLLESEFFGYKKGAFTGADRDKAGFLEIADQGTLFLDEIGEIDLNIQVKLLRAIEGAGYTPVGSTKLLRPDVRIISATNRDIKELIRKKAIREDFFYRIHIIPIYMPPLRERKEDIPLLVEHFLKTRDPGKRHLITAKIMDILLNYEWPGNVRELENTIHRFITLNRLDLIGVDLVASNRQDEITMAVSLENQDLPAVLEQVEKKMILDRLIKNKWSRDKTAKDLGVNRKALYRKIKLYGLSE